MYVWLIFAKVLTFKQSESNIESFRLLKKIKSTISRRRCAEMCTEKLTYIGGTLAHCAWVIPREWQQSLLSARRDWMLAVLISNNLGWSYSPIPSVMTVLREFSQLHLRETGWSPIYCRRRFLRRSAPSTRGPEWTDLWCIGCRARGIVE